jgi:hypothetical protein
MYTMVIAIRMLPIAHANTASTRGPTLRIARRSHVTINRNKSVGRMYWVSVRCAVCTSPVGDHTPATASAVTKRYVSTIGGRIEKKRQR